MEKKQKGIPILILISLSDSLHYLLVDGLRSSPYGHPSNLSHNTTMLAWSYCHRLFSRVLDLAVRTMPINLVLLFVLNDLTEKIELA